MFFFNTAYRTVIKIKIHSLVYYKNSEKCYKEMKKLQEFENSVTKEGKELIYHKEIFIIMKVLEGGNYGPKTE